MIQKKNFNSVFYLLSGAPSTPPTDTRRPAKAGFKDGCNGYYGSVVLVTFMVFMIIKPFINMIS